MPQRLSSCATRSISKLLAPIYETVRLVKAELDRKT